MLETQKRPGKLMAANRGEIAIRIFRAANELGLRTVSIFAEEDRFSIHRFKADEAYQLDSSKGPVGAYLDVEGIVTLAKQKGVTMIHPGYGFLSENASFARACAREGIIFIGPSPPSSNFAAPRRISSSLRKRTCVEMSGRVTDSVPDSPQQRSFNATGAAISALTTFSGACVFIGEWQGS